MEIDQKVKDNLVQLTKMRQKTSLKYNCDEVMPNLTESEIEFLSEALLDTKCQNISYIASKILSELISNDSSYFSICRNLFVKLYDRWEIREKSSSLSFHWPFIYYLQIFTSVIKNSKTSIKSLNTVFDYIVEKSNILIKIYANYDFKIDSSNYIISLENYKQFLKEIIRTLGNVSFISCSEKQISEDKNYFSQIPQVTNFIINNIEILRQVILDMDQKKEKVDIFVILTELVYKCTNFETLFATENLIQILSMVFETFYKSNISVYFIDNWDKEYNFVGEEESLKISICQIYVISVKYLLYASKDKKIGNVSLYFHKSICQFELELKRFCDMPQLILTNERIFSFVFDLLSCDDKFLFIFIDNLIDLYEFRGILNNYTNSKIFEVFLIYLDPNLFLAKFFLSTGFDHTFIIDLIISAEKRNNEFVKVLKKYIRYLITVDGENLNLFDSPRQKSNDVIEITYNANLNQSTNNSSTLKSDSDHFPPSKKLRTSQSVVENENEICSNYNEKEKSTENFIQPQKWIHLEHEYEGSLEHAKNNSENSSQNTNENYNEVEDLRSLLDLPLKQLFISLEKTLAKYHASKLLLNIDLELLTLLSKFVNNKC